MKILFLTNLYPPHYIGGYELICQTVNRAMQERGHQTRVLTSSHGVEQSGLPAGGPGVERSLRLQGFAGYPWLGLLKLRAVEQHNNRELRRLLAEFQPDVVHVFNLGGLSKSLAHTLQRANVPTVYFVSDHWLAQSLGADVWLRWWNQPATSLVHRMVRAGLQWCGARAWLDAQAPTDPVAALEFRRLYFCSDFLRAQAVSRGSDVAHAGVIHNAVNLTRFIPRRPSASCTRWLFVGRLTPEKGVLTLLRAVAAIRGSFEGTLTLCGRGEEHFEAELRRLVRTLKLPVEFAEASPAEMPAVYRRHDALVFASEWEEPFALTPLEAMASGLPVIATTTGGSAELFCDNGNALTFQAGDAAQLARKMLLLQNDPALRQRLATTGCMTVRAGFGEGLVMNRVASYVLETVATWRHHKAPAPTQPAASTAVPQERLAYV